MSNDNGVFVRLSDEMLIEVDKLKDEKKVKNRQTIIREALAMYISVYSSIRNDMSEYLQSRPAPN